MGNQTKNNDIPNCNICIWSIMQGYQFIGYRYHCSAQANKPAETVYDNDNCKLLFEVEGEEHD